MARCSFCGNSIKKGTGKIFVYASDKINNFCSMKCEKNLLKLKRKPLNVRWTEAYRKEHKKSSKPAEKTKEPEASVEAKEKGDKK